MAVACLTGCPMKEYVLVYVDFEGKAWYRRDEDYSPRPQGPTLFTREGAEAQLPIDRDRWSHLRASQFSIMHLEEWEVLCTLNGL